MVIYCSIWSCCFAASDVNFGVMHNNNIVNRLTERIDFFNLYVTDLNRYSLDIIDKFPLWGVFNVNYA